MNRFTPLRTVRRFTRSVILAASPTKAAARRRRADFRRDGFCILPQFVAPNLCDQIGREAEAYYDRQGVPLDRVDRAMNFHQESPAVRRVLGDPRLLEILDDLLGAVPVFHQSIFFHKGSEQQAHSDYIYLSTAPDFHLCRFWLACEDIAADAGPLVYYPGSHRLPIQNVRDRYRQQIGAIQERLRREEAELEKRYQGRRRQTGESLLTCFFFDLWLNEIHEALARGNFQPRTFLARKGDAIIWHANLVHGGSPVREPGRSRRSLVAHYLTEDVQRCFDMNYVDCKNEMRAVLQVRN